MSMRSGEEGGRSKEEENVFHGRKEEINVASRIDGQCRPIGGSTHKCRTKKEKGTRMSKEGVPVGRSCRWAGHAGRPVMPVGESKLLDDDRVE